MDIVAYLGIINLARTEQSFQGIISWDEEAGKVYKKLASNVEEDKKKVDTDEAEKGVDLRHRGLLLEIVEHGILGELHHLRVNTLLGRDDIGQLQAHEDLSRRWEGWEEPTSLSIWPIWCCVRSWKDMSANCCWEEKK